MLWRFPAKYIAWRLIALVLIGAFFRVAAAPLTGPIVNPANGHYYYLLEQSDWESAEAESNALGGNLVTINNQAEQDWVFGEFGSWGGVDRSIWIGLNDIASEGSFEWVSGEPVLYTHWNSGEPNNGGPGGADEDGVHMWHPNYCCGPDGYWNDVSVSNVLTDLTPIHGVAEVVVNDPNTGTLITFDEDLPGAYANGFQSVQSPKVMFSTENGNVVKVFQGAGSNTGETDGLGLGGDGKFEPNAIVLDFTCPVDFLRLEFGNDDRQPLPGPDLVPGVDYALVSAFLDGVLIGFSTVVVNGNNLLDQSIVLEGVVFDKAIFEYVKADDDLTNITSLTEVIDNVEFFCADLIVDSDGDGVGDSDDSFPDDPSEWSDTDADGIGDNGDQFPEDPTEWADTDGDGVGDNGDQFPNDSAEWADSDSDGFGDNGDAFPNSDTRPSIFVDGCDSNVPNMVLGNGSTINDLVGNLLVTAKNHGQFVKSVNELARDLKNLGMISANEKGRISKCTGQAGEGLKGKSNSKAGSVRSGSDKKTKKSEK